MGQKERNEFFSILSLISCGVALKSANQSGVVLGEKYPDLKDVTGPPKCKQVKLYYACSWQGRGDSLGPRLLPPRRLGLATPGGKIPSQSDKGSDAHSKSHH